MKDLNMVENLKSDLELLETLVKVSKIVDKSLVVNLDVENKVVRFNYGTDLITMDFKHVADVFIHETTKQYVVRTECEVARCKATNIEFRHDLEDGSKAFEVYFDRPDDVVLWVKSIPLYSEFIHEAGFPLYEEVSEKEYVRSKSTAELIMTKRYIDPMIGCYKLSKFNFSKHDKSVYRAQMYTLTDKGPKEVDIYYDRINDRLNLKRNNKGLVKLSPEETLTKYLSLLNQLYSSKYPFKLNLDEGSGIKFIRCNSYGYEIEFPLPCSKDEVDRDTLKTIFDNLREFIDYSYTATLNRIWGDLVHSLNSSRFNVETFKRYSVKLDTRCTYRWADVVNNYSYRLKIGDAKLDKDIVVSVYDDREKGNVNLDIKLDDVTVFERKYVQTHDFEKTMHDLVNILAKI